MTERKSKGGRRGVREGVEGATVVPLRPTSAAAVAESAIIEDRRFLHLESGIHRRRDGGSPLFLCGPLDVLAETRDDEGRNWGLLLAWKDRDGLRHEEAFPRALFAGDGNEIRSRLADGGLTLGSGPQAKSAFLEWLGSLASRVRARSVTRIGWHGFGGRSVFVLPDATIGTAGERVVLQTGDREPSLFGVLGTAEDWRVHVGSQCRGNSRLVLAASCAFAAPLLGLIGEEGGGVCLKARSSRTGGARTVARFRILFLSTGELGLADLNREAGKTTKAGQEVRFADLPADAGYGMGLFEHTHDLGAPEAFARHLQAVTREYYGAPLRAFLQRLVATAAREGEEALRARLRARIAALGAEWLAAHPDASGQVRSVAARFAMIAVGGELATEYGLTGWDADTPAVMAQVCFRAWLSERGTVGRREEEQAVQQLRDFLSRHGESRFERWVDEPPAEGKQGEAQDGPPGERFRTQQRAGWKRWMKEADGRRAWRFYLTADGMKEALAGLNQRSAKQVLEDRGFLVVPGKSDKNSTLINPPGHKKVRAYEVMAAILGAEEGDR